MKFTSYEAHGIQPLVANSPLTSWLYTIFDVNAFSALLGVFEIAAAVLIAIKPLAPKISVVGSIMAVGLFLGTISFLFTTPGIGEAIRRRISGAVGQFLIKDIALIGLAAWTLGDSMRAVRRSTAPNVLATEAGSR